MYQYRYIIYKKRIKVRCIINAAKSKDIYKCINIDTSFIRKSLKERCINNAGKTMDIYKCINIDTSFIKKNKGEMYK